ncbi:hypothetical protein EMCRGX_G023020 [Ephydatia muelleri]
MVHRYVKELYEELKTIPDRSWEELLAMSQQCEGIYLNKSTFSSAMLAAGGLLDLTQQVVSGKLKNGMALIRPPGHHADRGCCSGFCLFNNVAIAAQAAIEKMNVKRVLIVDWDVHHGNGTQRIFWNNNKVLLFSFHRYDNGNFYPSSPIAGCSYVGGENALGYNMNMAWSNAIMGDAEYIAAVNRVLLPVAYEFNPELVLISSGFDSAEGDPLGGFKVTPAGYAHMTHALSALADGKVVIALEGGYNLASVSASTCACVAALLGDPLPRVPSLVPNIEGTQCIEDLLCCLSKYWCSLQRPNGGRGCAAPGPTAERDSIVCDDGHVCGPLPPATIQMPPPTFLPVVQIQTRKTFPIPDSAFRMPLVPWCRHVKDVLPLPPPTDFDVFQKCVVCSTNKDVWLCLICHHAYCGHLGNRHISDHQKDVCHGMALCLSDPMVWCYTCNTYVVDNEMLGFLVFDAFKKRFGPLLEQCVVSS